MARRAHELLTYHRATTSITQYKTLSFLLKVSKTSDRAPENSDLEKLYFLILLEISSCVNSRGYGLGDHDNVLEVGIGVLVETCLLDRPNRGVSGSVRPPLQLLAPCWLREIGLIVPLAP